MTWLVPAAWILGGVAVAALAAAHVLSRRRPPPEPLPTARFVPDRATRVTARGIAPSDLLLLLVRAAALAALAAAFAGPVLSRPDRGVRRVIAVERSRWVAGAAESRDSARAWHRDGDVIIAFDTTSETIDVRRLDTLRATRAPGSLSVALAAAARAAARLATDADSIELVIVSPFVERSVDAATLPLRRAWPGRVRLVRVAAVPGDTTAHPIELPDDTADALGTAVRLAGAQSTGAVVLVRRQAPSAADSAWAREGPPGRVLVHWPTLDASPAGWRARATRDTNGAVVAGSHVVVAPFERRWVLEGRAIARWADGEPAAVERAIGDGCLRDVAIPLEGDGDLPLRPELRPLVDALTRPCAPAGGAPIASAALASLGGSGPLAPAASLMGRDSVRSPWTPWLFAAALALLGVEWLLRRRSAETASHPVRP